MKALWNFFGGCIAFLLCVLLVVSLILCPLVSFLTDSVEPANIIKIVVEGGLLNGSDASASGLTVRLSTTPGQPPMPFADFDLSALENIDLSALEDALKTLANSDFLDPEELMEAVELPEGTQVEEKKLIDNLAKSELVQALISSYAADIMDAAMGIEKDPALTKETVTKLLKPHIGGLVEVVKDSLPEGTKVNEEKITQTIDTVIEETMPELVGSLPPAQDVAHAITPEEDARFYSLMAALKFVRAGKLRLACILLAAVLALLVILFRLPSPSGLRWVGVAGLFSALLVGSIGLGLQTRAVSFSLQQMAGDAAMLVKCLISSLSSGFVSFAIIYGIGGLALVVLSGILRAVSAHR